MKTWYISFFISLLLLAIPGGGSAFVKESPAQSPEELDVYLCIGQSNMAGRGTLLPELTGTLEGVYLLNDRGEFESAGNPLNKYSTIRKDLSMQALGPAYSFARKMAALSPRPVGLVVNARGGSSIDSWLKGSKDGYYEAALERVRLAQKQGGVLKAVIWHQGEADCQDPEAYRKKLALLVETLRADLGQPELPFVVGQLPRSPPPCRGPPACPPKGSTCWRTSITPTSALQASSSWARGMPMPFGACSGSRPKSVPRSWCRR